MDFGLPETESECSEMLKKMAEVGLLEAEAWKVLEERRSIFQSC